MSMTLQDMAEAVLKEIGAISADETPSDLDAGFVKDKYRRWHRLMQKRFLVDWTIEGPIPDGAEDAVTLLVAYNVQPAFGQPKDQNMYLEGRTLLFEYRNDGFVVPAMTITSF